MLRCRSEARKRFAAIRSDVLVKLELLDNKHVQDIVHQVRKKYVSHNNNLKVHCMQLRRLMSSLTNFHLDCQHLLLILVVADSSQMMIFMKSPLKKGNGNKKNNNYC